MVLKSMTIDPGRMPSITPFGPRTTSSTCAGIGRQSAIRSAFAATSAGVLAAVAPCEATSATTPWLRLATVSGNPAFNMLMAIGRPILPRPMNPARSVLICCSHFPDDGFGRRRCACPCGEGTNGPAVLRQLDFLTNLKGHVLVGQVVDLD